MARVDDDTAGNLVLSVLRNLEVPERQRACYNRVVGALRQAGFNMRLQARSGIRTEDGWVRVDLVAQFRGGYVAIELNRRHPRRRSLAALQSMDMFRILALRGAPEPLPKVSSINAIISLKLDKVPASRLLGHLLRGHQRSKKSPWGYGRRPWKLVAQR